MFKLPLLPGPIAVECIMNSETGHVITRIHHDGESRVYITGYDNVGEYERHYEYYGFSRSSLQALKSSSLFCNQYMKVSVIF